MDEVVTFLDFFIYNTMFFSSPFLRLDCTTCMYTVNDYMNKKLTRSNTGKRRMSRPELFIKERNEKKRNQNIPSGHEAISGTSGAGGRKNSFEKTASEVST